MGTNVNLKNQTAIQREGLDALVQRLGRAGAIRFLQLFSGSRTDSLSEKRERDAVLESMGVSIDDILMDMENREAT